MIGNCVKCGKKAVMECSVCGKLCKSCGRAIGHTAGFWYE